MPSDLSSWIDTSETKTKSKETPKSPKSKKPSLLTRILTQIKNQPIRPSDFPMTPDSGPPGVLINIDYQGDAGVAKIKLYDTNKAQVYEWLDNTQHHPYCLTDFTQNDLSQQNDVVGHSGFLKLENGHKYNLLRDQEEEYTIIVARDPLAIGGRPDSIREKLGRDHAWEADIRYTQCYTMDRALTPGLMYRVQDTKLIPVPQKFSPEDASKIRQLFKDDKELSELIEEYLPLFLTPATSLPRLAIDIEVESEFIDRIPDPAQAPQPIISVALADDRGTGTLLMLQRGTEQVAPDNLPDTVTIEFFEDEKELIETVFRILWRTPILLTFNGDNFDLQYLANRAKKLDIPSKDNPIRLRGGFRGNPEADLEYGVHIDLYRFFHNRSIQIYAFRNRYSEVRLETISQALLGEGKLELPDQINKIPANLLAQYNWQDASLTLRLTQFDNDLVMGLILLLMRVSHQGMHDLTRTAVSNWIRSLLYYAHRQRNYLIPRQDEIAAFKGEAVTEAIIKGKKYMGAIVVEPKEGVHFNVTVLDFASLYPSIMKAYNLSYETVRCDHSECKDNLVPGTPHWVCKRREGITSLLIGLIRDVRVEYFKPRAKDKTLTAAQRSWFSVVEQALKVYLNACLPFDEEVVIRNRAGQIEKRDIASLKDDWEDLEILSVNAEANTVQFGTPIFVPIKGFAATGNAEVLRINFGDGRRLRCTSNHIIPVYSTQPGRSYDKKFQIHEVPASELKPGDELLLCKKMPLPELVPEKIFIPEVVETSGEDYARKYCGFMDFNGTNLVRVKSIAVEENPQPVFDLETGNGWFVTTHGIVTHNSYGVLGASHFPLYCAPAAESVTAVGRYAITQTIEKAEALGVTVLYGDTDSLFLDRPSKEQLKQLIEYSEKELRVELDVEKEYRYVALSSRKKNYLGVTKDGQVDIKGLTGKKRNTPLFLQEAFMEMIDILSQVQDPDGFTSAKDRILHLAREKLTMLERREFDVKDLAIRVQLTKSLSAYTKTTPQHVKAAKQLQEAGKEVTAGDIIAFVKTSGGVKPVEQASPQDIDVTKYKDLVKSTFEQVLDALGVEWLDTIGMRRLDTFFG
ncbi:MAG: DNA polymerase domain-containing protein [Promethearchaeota archaeon]